MPDPFKLALRATIKDIRSKIPASYRSTSSNQICTRIRALEHYRRAKRIALYFAVNGEVDLSEIWNSAPLQGKFCYFPVLNENLTLSFLPATPNTPFKKNKYGIPEPDVKIELAIPVEQLDLILMPLVAFDLHCTRLGMGSGYYDRTFTSPKHGLLLGVAYQFQKTDFINPHPWDIPLNAVITPKATYWRE